MAEADGEVVRWLLRAEGRVQGVGYRERVRRAGRELGLAGEVWNEADGTVSIEVEGTEASIARFAQRISGRYGASDARSVSRVTTLRPKDEREEFRVRL